MPYQLRITCIPFLFAITAAALISGCGEAVSPPPVKQEAVKLTPEQEFAAALKKAEAGDAQSQGLVGVMYAKGESTPKDMVKALEWCQKGVSQGDAEAQRCLGVMHANGDAGVPKDMAKAIEWLLMSAAQGSAKAQNNLGAMYADGDGIPKDDVKAMEWWLKAAVQGNATAQLAIGRMYAIGGDGVPADAAKASEWYQKAAAQGDAVAQTELGNRYFNGEGVEKDNAKTVEWYQKAAVQGHAEAQYNLGTMFDQGNGIPKDAAKAVEWRLKAAVQGHAHAQVLIGASYFFGGGSPIDRVLAYAWVNLAASKGNADGIGMRDAMKLSSTDLAEAQRLSSGWKKGQVLAREAGSSKAGTSTPSPAGSLSKKSTGTLFVVNNTGHAITNQHVAGGCTELRIQGRDGVAKLVTEDKVNDLALVQIQGAVKEAAAIASEPGKLRQGEDIIAFGFPLNSVLSSGGNLTPGVVSALTGLGNNTNQIQITAPIQPGSSGSPVLNKKGDVVGVVSMKLSDSKMASATGQIGQNVNFAVSGQTLKTFLDTHKVSYSTGGFLSREKSTADLADEARKWTLVVECWK